MARELIAIGVAAALALSARGAAAQELAAAGAGSADSAGRVQETEVLRETFAYSGGARDPFNSLIKLTHAGPELNDLQLVGIYMNHRVHDASVAVVREKTEAAKRHKLRVGDQLGRLRVVAIRPKEVTFAIQDFGFERQETLSLRKQEDVTP